MKKCWLAAIFCSFFTVAFAQHTAVNSEPYLSYQYGLKLFEKEKFAAAAQQFGRVLAFAQNQPHLLPIADMIADANFYKAACAYELEKEDAPLALQTFLSAYPTHIKANQGKFYLGKFYYNAENYAQAALFLGQVDASRYDVETASSLRFMLGYSYYATKKFAEAKKNFSQIKDVKNEYSQSAIYYLGFIAYQEQKWDESLANFKALAESKLYKQTVPYYITQIYYQQKQDDSLLAYAIPTSQKQGVKQIEEISNLVGQTLYRKEKYAEALPYLKRFVDGGKNVKPLDQYQLGFAAYKGGDCAEVIRTMPKVASGNDSLAQSASYILGTCYLNAEQKEKALNAFFAASKLDQNKDLKEVSSFNHAKLNVELARSNVMLHALQNFIKDFPKSIYLNEARTILGQVLVASRNYREAYDVIAAITDKNYATKRSFQQIAYYRGVEIYNQNKLDEAAKLFTESLQYPIEKKFQALAHFWRGEAFFQTNKLKDALLDMERFLSLYENNMQLSVENSPATANYTAGYALFKEAKYRESVDYLEKAKTLILAGGEKTTNNAYIKALLPDLYLILGDVNFALNRYPQAINYYNIIISQKANAADYALLQKAIIDGLTGKNDEKLKQLENLVNNFPKSLYLDNALLEIANIYFIKDDYTRANTELDRLISLRPNSLLVRNALLTKGLIAFNDDKLDDAMALYKQVVTRFPNTNESRDALVGIKNIYIAQNNADGYINYAKDIPQADLSVSSQDSLVFFAAEKVYNSGNADKAIEELTKYLNRYQSGVFALNARFFRADAYFRKKNTASALADYVWIIGQPRSIYTERALSRAAAIQFETKDYVGALSNFEQLEQIADARSRVVEAQLGQMRTLFLANNLAKSQALAQRVLWNENSNLDNKTEANLYLGKIAIANEQLEQAIIEFTKVYEATKNIWAAEAKLGIAQAQFKRKDYNAAQATIFEMAEKLSAYEDLLARAFMLLADTYVEQKNNFQAIATLESLIDNYKKEPVFTEAKNKLATIKNMPK